jgi:ComF family protein
MTMLSRALAHLAAPLYLPACAACDAVLAVDEPPPLCGRCRPSLVANEPACPRCAEPIAGPVAIECARCRRAPPPQRATIAPWRYGAAVAIALRRLKFNDRTDLARALAPLAAPFVAALAAVDTAEAAASTGSVTRGGAVDLVVPVPLHWRRLARRGYNHAELLAVAIAGALPVARALARRRATRPQPGLDAAARADNVRGAFAATRRGRARLAGARVLLVDDITTTGATLAAAAAAARDAGAADVVAFAFARAE